MSRGPLIRPRGYPPGRCRYGCTVPVMWVKLVDVDGKPKINKKTRRPSVALLNVGSVPDGNVQLTGAGRGRVMSPREHRDPDQELFEVHARTCKHKTINNTREIPR